MRKALVGLVLLAAGHWAAAAVGAPQGGQLVTIGILPFQDDAGTGASPDFLRKAEQELRRQRSRRSTPGSRWTSPGRSSRSGSIASRERDPNELWTGITREYFGIEPHPELAWWAARGQLVDSPGYMMNYAAGAILAADLRARLCELRGSRAVADPGWYAATAGHLYRFGLERPAKDVIEEFLGRPVSPQALLDDMARAAAARPASGVH